MTSEVRPPNLATVDHRTPVHTSAREREIQEPGKEGEKEEKESKESREGPQPGDSATHPATMHHQGGGAGRPCGAGGEETSPAVPAKPQDTAATPNWSWGPQGSLPWVIRWAQLRPCGSPFIPQGCCLLTVGPPGGRRHSPCPSGRAGAAASVDRCSWVAAGGCRATAHGHGVSFGVTRSFGTRGS